MEQADAFLSLICYDEFIGAGTHLLSFLSASSPPAEWWVLLWKMDLFFSCSQGSQSHSPAVLGILLGKSKTSQGRSCGLQYNRPQGTLRRELELRVWIQSPRFNLHKLLRPWGKNSVYISFSGEERGDTCIILTKCRLHNTNPRAKSWEEVANGASVEKKPSWKLHSCYQTPEHLNNLKHTCLCMDQFKIYIQNLLQKCSTATFLPI